MRNLILSTSLCYRSYRLFFARPSLKSLWSFIKPFFVVRDELKYKGWPSAIKKLLELKNVTLLKACLRVQRQKSGNFFITWVGSHKMFIATQRHVDLYFHPIEDRDPNETN